MSSLQLKKVSVAKCHRSLASTIAVLLGTFISIAAATEAVAQTNSKARIVRENKCKVQIEGGDFQIGETVYFSNSMPDSELPVIFTVIIKQKAKKKVTTWVGKIQQSAAKACKDSLGASLDEAKTAKNRRVPFLFDLGIALGQNRASQRGLSWYAPNETQSIPTLATQTVTLTTYPFFATSASLLSSSKLLIAFEQEKTAQSGVQDPAGGKNQIDLKKIDTSWEFGFFFLGDSHPTGVSAGYSYFGFNTSVTQSPFERSVLRDLNCHNIAIGLHQGVFTSGIFRLQLDIDQSLVSRCTIESIAEEEAYKIEAKQFALGRKKESIIPASQITNPGGKVTTPSQTRFGASMALYPVTWIGLKFSVDYWTLGGKIPTKAKSLTFNLSSFEYKLGLHGAF